MNRRFDRRDSASEEKSDGKQPESAEPKTDDYTEIERLGELHSKGLITDEEFEAKKKQILGL